MPPPAPMRRTRRPPLETGPLVPFQVTSRTRRGRRRPERTRPGQRGLAHDQLPWGTLTIHHRRRPRTKYGEVNWNGTRSMRTPREAAPKGPDARRRRSDDRDVTAVVRRGEERPSQRRRWAFWSRLEGTNVVRWQDSAHNGRRAGTRHR